jgi:hypothetical protein
VAFDSLRIGTTFLDVAPPMADFDANGKVDGVDLSAIKNNFGSTSASHAQGDTNGDLDVDGGDFLVWQRQFGAMYTVPTVFAVPEPGATIYFAALGVAASLHWRSFASRRHAPTTWRALPQERQRR